MSRTMLIHLNVEVQDENVTADQVADFIMAAFQIGYEGSEPQEHVGPITVEVPLAEEI